MQAFDQAQNEIRVSMIARSLVPIIAHFRKHNLRLATLQPRNNPFRVLVKRDEPLVSPMF